MANGNTNRRKLAAQLAERRREQAFMHRLARTIERQNPAIAAWALTRVLASLIAKKTEPDETLDVMEEEIANLRGLVERGIRQRVGYPDSFLIKA